MFAHIEQFPHILSKIQLLWHSPELAKYLHSLFLSDRIPERQGFPSPVFEELMYLDYLNRVVRALDLAEKEHIKPSYAYKRLEESDFNQQGTSSWLKAF